MGRSPGSGSGCGLQAALCVAAARCRLRAGLGMAGPFVLEIRRGTGSASLLVRYLRALPPGPAPPGQEPGVAMEEGWGGLGWGGGARLSRRANKGFLSTVCYGFLLVLYAPSMGKPFSKPPPPAP